ncbi:glycosyltransferase [Rhizobium sp. CC-YZS058]|uniref:glycosyltransferase n=1 Tax=Rhizobium sp. CC-YZS058 TaxID=3042153 RepID=UPI002B057279|nr:glycosyltransferase [Rhizobium sp. CC-YZS058]MEA3535280.1 glycosyltransferase [Rhizobium sp. CC-YZS058]
MTPTAPTTDAERASLRILQVIEPSGGGSGRHFLDLCHGLMQRGHHVEAVYSPVRAEKSFVRELKAMGLPDVHKVAMRRAPGRSDLAAHRALRAIISRGRFDIIHGHSSKAGALTRLRLPGRHAQRVYTPHAFRTMDPTLSAGARRLYGSIESFLGRYLTDHLICVSEDEYRHALSLGIPEARLSVIVNGAAQPVKDMAATVRASFGIAPDTFVFGAIGRLSHQKAPERMIEAFRLAAAKVPGAHLIMIGSGELETPVRAAIAASGLQSRIHLTSAFTGPQAVSAFDCLVMPSRYEAMSYVMLEAAAVAKPIVSTDVGGATTAIEHGVTGFIVPNDGDTAKLAAAMIEVAEPATFARLKEGAERARSRFSLDTMIDRTEALYKRLVAR